MTTIQNVIDVILDQIPGGRLEETVDTVKCGDPAREVKGIVTTFLASTGVIRKTIELGANFIITHEPTFYNHLDEVEKLADDPIYREKRALLDDHGIVVWRFHDHWHRHEPDGIGMGVVKALEWEPYLQVDSPSITIPTMTLSELASHLKARLGIATLRVVGDLQMPCRRVALMVGAPGAEWQMRWLTRDDVDVLVTGEVHEWETSEYVRDAVAQGRPKALIVAGHANSEEPGMAYLVEWLRPLVPGVQITHVPVGDAFSYL